MYYSSELEYGWHERIMRADVILEMIDVDEPILSRVTRGDRELSKGVRRRYGIANLGGFRVRALRPLQPILSKLIFA